jgi:hypothetical protein
VRLKKGNMPGSLLYSLFMLPFVLAAIFLTLSTFVGIGVDIFGVDTTGVVYGHETHDDAEGGTSYTLRYKYRVAGSEHNKSAHVSKNEYKRIQDGEELRVRFLPGLSEMSAKLPDTTNGLFMTLFMIGFTTFWDLLIGVFCWGIFIYPFVEKNILRNGVATEAQVVDLIVDATGEDMIYKLKYRFYLASGACLDGEVSVDRSQYYATNRGDRITVLYLPSKPQDHRTLEYSQFEIVT